MLQHDTELKNIDPAKVLLNNSGCNSKTQPGKHTLTYTRKDRTNSCGIGEKNNYRDD